MIKVEVRESNISGKGVFARGPISISDVILRMDDSRVVTPENPINPDLGEESKHCDYLPDGTTVLMPPPECYINHSCSPNVYVFSVGSDRYVLPVRDIEKDEEITYDYSINALDGDVWACTCGSSNCRGEHKCDFFHLPREIQIAYLPYIDPSFLEYHKERFSLLLNSKGSL